MTEPTDREAVGTFGYLVGKWFSRSSAWLLVRIAIIVGYAAVSLSSAIRPGPRAAQLRFVDTSHPYWWLPLLNFLGWPLFMPVFLGFVSIFRDLEWARPDWRHNPFDIYRPFDLFELFGPMFAAGGLATIACAPFLDARLALLGSWILLNGASIWLSVRLWAHLFRGKMIG